MLPLTQRLLATFPALHRTQPLSPALPDLLKFATLTLLRNPRPALKMIKHPETISPGSDHDINQAELLAEEEGTFWIHLTRELFEVVEELGLPVLQTFLALVLEETVVSRDDSRADICECQWFATLRMSNGLTVCPDPRASAKVGIIGQEFRRVVGVGFLEELAQHGALV